MPFLFAYLITALIGFYLGKWWGGRTTLPPSDRKERETLGRALQLAAEGNFQQACAVLKEHMTSYPEALRVYQVLGTFYRRTGEHERAIRIHQNIYHSPIADQQQKVDALVELGLDYLAYGDKDKGASILEEVSDNHPKLLRANRQLAYLYLGAGKWEAAYRHIHKFMRHQKGWDVTALASLQYMIGMEALREGNDRKAQDCFRNALELDENLPGAQVGLAKALLARNNAKKALEGLQKALELHPEHCDSLLPVLKDASYSLKRYEAFEGLLRQFLTQHAEYPGPWAILARHLRDQGRRDESIRVLEQALERFPEHHTLKREFLIQLRDHSPALAEKQAYDLLSRMEDPPPVPELQHLEQYRRELAGNLTNDLTS